LVKIYGKQIVYSDAGTWHPEAHILLGLVVFTTWKDHSLGRMFEYLKDVTEAFNDYYSCIIDGLCNLGLLW